MTRRRARPDARVSRRRQIHGRDGSAVGSGRPRVRRAGAKAVGRLGLVRQRRGQASGARHPRRRDRACQGKRSVRARSLAGRGDPEREPESLASPPRGVRDGTQAQDEPFAPAGPAPAPAPALAAAPPAPSGATPGNLVAASSGFDDDVHPALAPFRAEDWSIPSDAAPASTSTALVAGCTLHDLAPEDKRKVAKLIKQVVEYAESKKRLECELDDTHSRLDACERSRDAARKAEETRKAELRVLTAKLDKALATVEAYRRTEKMEKTEKTTDAPERAQRPGPAAELWRASPMTRAVVDEVRAVLRRGHTSTRAHEHTDASAGNSNSTHDAHDRKGGRSPAERQRPPLAVAPTSAGGGGGGPSGGDAQEPDEGVTHARGGGGGGGGGGGATRAAERSRQPPRFRRRFAQPRARLQRLRLRKTPSWPRSRRARRRRRRASAAGGSGRDPRRLPGRFPAPPRSVLLGVPRPRSSASACFASTRARAPPARSTSTRPRRLGPRLGRSARRVKRGRCARPWASPRLSRRRGRLARRRDARALVRLDDDMTAYGAATVREGRLGDVFATLDGVSPPRRKEPPRSRPCATKARAAWRPSPRGWRVTTPTPSATPRRGRRMCPRPRVAGRGGGEGRVAAAGGDRRPRSGNPSGRR